jgi:hypothetical protein
MWIVPAFFDVCILDHSVSSLQCPSMRFSHWLLLGVAILLPFIAKAQVIVSEVMWAGSDLSSADEWIELAGIGDTDVSGWTLSYLNGDGVETAMVRFASGTVIGSGEYVLVANFAAAESRVAIEPDIVTTDVTLPNTKLRLLLRDASGALIDSVDDGIGAPFAGQNTSSLKASMERIDLSIGGDIKENWRTAGVSRGFDSGAVLMRGTPGSVNGEIVAIVVSSSSSTSYASSESSSSVNSSSESSMSSEFSSSSSSELSSSSSSSSSVSSSSSSSSSSSANNIGRITISGVLPNPVGSDDGIEWIEFMNDEQTYLSLQGWRLVTRKGVAKALDSLSLGPREVRRVPAQELGIGLVNTEDSLELIDAFGRQMSFVAWTSAKEGRVYPYQGENDEEAVSSSSSALSAVAQSIAVQSHVMPPVYQTGAIINEIFPAPINDDEWIELWNPTDYAIDLSGWTIDDVKNGGSRPHILASGTLIPSSGFLVLSMKQYHISLNNDGDDVRLLSPDEKISIEVTYPKMKNGQSFSRTSIGWCMTDAATPGIQNKCVVKEISKKTSAKKTAKLSLKKVSVKSKSKKSTKTAAVIQPELYENLQKLVLTEPQNSSESRENTTVLGIVVFIAAALGGFVGGKLSRII